MKVRKLLALVLTLLLVLAYGAFAAEGEAQEPGQQTAGQPAQQEAAATQAFERSLTVKGLFVWEWNFTQATVNSFSYSNATTTGLRVYNNGGKYIGNQSWQALVLNLVYKVSKDVRLEGTLYNTIRWGEGASDGRSATNAFVASSYDFPDTFAGLGGSNITGSVSGSTATINAKNLLRLEEINLVWSVGGFVNDIYVGRVTNPWGFGSGLMLGARAGVDRIKWVGKTKMFGYMALPIFFLELRSDKDTTLQGDERLILEPALVLVGPGKFIEVLGITWAFDGLRKRVDVTDGANDALASYNLVALSMKMRAGSFAVINFEFLAIGGRNDSTPDAVYSIRRHTRLDLIKVFLNADFNLIGGLLTVTPEFAFVTAPNVDTAVGKDAIVDASIGGVSHRAGNIGFATQFYQVGGIVMQNPTNLFGTGWNLGLFSAALKVKANLMGGTLIPWLKFTWATTMSQYTMQPYTTGATLYSMRYTKAGTKSLGFEIDLGVDVKLTEGLTFMFEFGILFLPSDIKNGVVASDWSKLNYNTAGTGSTFTILKNPMAINVKLIYKF